MTVAAANFEGSKVLAGADPVVILVDNKRRDLNCAALIAHHLEARRIPCHLEPLEAFRAVVGAYRPGMIIFNHLNASHLVAWSRRLAEIGVLVGVLPNEGIIYQEESRPFMSGRYHRDAHVDYFFVWNEVHGDAIRAEGFDRTARIETLGVPRFDFYFEPWSRTLPPAPQRRSDRPRVLLCTNFIFAKMHDRMEEADKLFAGKQQTNPLVRNYPEAVRSHWRSRRRVLEYAAALLEDGRVDILLRPHPMEEHAFYADWLESLPAGLRSRIDIDVSSNIASLILDCDLQISCETCTTAIESWIAGKPTIELIFDKHPMLYKDTQAVANYPCDDPAKLPAMVARNLAAPDQLEKRELRARHLATWCATPDGRTSWRIARVIADAIATKKPADWSKLTAGDFRRAVKLKAYQRLGHAYHFDPLLWIKASLMPQRYATKDRTYSKSIRPRDVAETRRRFKEFSEDRVS
jgi:surface carbohydrate biosynthesis protein